MEKFSSPIDFRNHLYAFQESRIILTAYELDLFSVLKPKGSSAAEVSESIHCNTLATGRLLNALCAIGLLKKQKKNYFNTQFSAKYLDKGSPEYLKGFGHTINMWHTWSDLTQIVKTGKIMKTPVAKNLSAVKAEAFIEAMHERAKISAAELIMNIGLEEKTHMLDIGGGSGVYAFEFVKGKTARKAVIFDLPHIIPITGRYVKSEKLTKQISLVAGNYLTDDFGKGFDFILLSAIIHINSAEENQQLIKKCFRAMKSSGIIAIQDHIMEEDRTKPYAGALFSINMLVATENGDTYTENEIKTWLTSAGFSFEKRLETFKNAVMVARKP